MREDADKQSSERVDGSDLIGQHGSPCFVTVQQEHVACNEHYSLLTAVRYYNYTVTHGVLLLLLLLLLLLNSTL